ncbi:MAG: IS200/IS605 family transposase [Bacteroidales bacterium]|nr:IS200/IS605 family transposase [Bacteroidales bacterium]
MGAGTCLQIYIQIVFAVKGRNSLIGQKWKEDLNKYITGIVQNNNQKMLAINSMHDHIHFLIEMKPSCCLSDLVREVKKSSNSFIKDKKIPRLKFQWKKCYDAFSYSHSALDDVIAYISNQEKHHEKRSFKEEYPTFLRKYDIEFNEDYLLEWIDD